MGLPFSKSETNSKSSVALNEYYAAGDAQSYRELEQSIYREKQGMAPASRGYAAPQQSPPNSHPPTSSSASAVYAPANRAHPQPSSASSSSSANNMPNGYSYSHSNGGGYGGYGATYGGTNGRGHNAAPAAPQGMYHTFCCCFGRRRSSYLHGTITFARELICIPVRPSALPARRLTQFRVQVGACLALLWILLEMHQFFSLFLCSLTREMFRG